MNLDFAQGSTRDEKIPVDVHLTSGAYQLFREENIEYIKETMNITGDLQYFWSKAPSFVARIALVIHVVKNILNPTDHADKLEFDTMRAAINIVRWYANEASRVYGLLNLTSETSEQKDIRLIKDVIRKKGGKATANEIKRSINRLM